MGFVTGLPYGNPSRKMGRVSVLFFFSVSVKVLPVTPLVSGVFVRNFVAETCGETKL